MKVNDNWNKAALPLALLGGVVIILVAHLQHLI